MLIWVQVECFDVGVLFNKMSGVDSDCGVVVSFFGQVWGGNGLIVLELEYYFGVIEKVLICIVIYVCKCWDL